LSGHSWWTFFEKRTVCGCGIRWFRFAPLKENDVVEPLFLEKIKADENIVKKGR
jgi:hypothetical protein